MYHPITPLARLTMLALAAHCAAAPLNFCYEDVPQPPWSMPDGTGLNLDLLRLVADRLHEHFTFNAKPWKRCLEEVRTGSMDAVVGAADTPERRTLGIFPNLPNGQTDVEAALAEDNFNVFLRVGSGSNWDGKKFTLAHGAIVVPRGYVVADELRKAGYPVDEVIKSAEDGLRLLTTGSADIALLYGHSAQMLLQDSRYKGHVTQATIPYAVVPIYLMVSYPTYEQDPKRILAIWAAIRSARHSTDYEKHKAAALRPEILN